MKEENLHAGHRERVIKKFITSNNGVLDHELLEILLFSFLPRIDTNPIAHRLIQTFGSLKGVFLATTEQLLSVKGIGKKTAANIKLIGMIYERINDVPKKSIKNSFDAFKLDLIERFKGESTEVSFLILLDNKFKELTTLSFENSLRSSVTMEASSIVSAFAVHKPKYALLSHNHLSGSVEPSEQDDFTTKKICLLCEINSVEFVDHIIVCNKEAFSYRSSGKLEFIKEKTNLKKIIELLE